jgi:biopolymer transport protein ExbD
MSFRSRRHRELPAIDLTPMLDVMFNLVLFFVVTTNFQQDQEQTPAIDVELPRSSAQTVINESTDLNLWVTAEGSIYIDEEPVDLAGLKAAMRERAAKGADSLVVIKADEGVQHGRVVQIMDLAKRYGLNKLAIATEASDDAGSP